MRWNSMLFCGLIGLLFLSAPLRAQNNRPISWLLSMDMGAQRLFTAKENSGLQVLQYEISPGIRLVPSFQIEVPFGINTRWNPSSRSILSQPVFVGLAAGYHWDTSVMGTTDLTISLKSDLGKRDLNGLELSVAGRLFLDSTEQAFLILGGGLFSPYGGAGKYGSIQAGFGIRLKRTRR